LDLISEFGFNMPADHDMRFNIANRDTDDCLTFSD
jgi:hypothetical protein